MGGALWQESNSRRIQQQKAVFNALRQEVQHSKVKADVANLQAEKRQQAVLQLALVAWREEVDDARCV